MAEDGRQQEGDEGSPESTPGLHGIERLHHRIDSHSERLTKLEANREHDRERIDQLRQGLIDADQKIESRFRELQQHIDAVQKTVNKTFWLVMGGFSVIVTLGGITLWAIRLSNGIASLAGGG